MHSGLASFTTVEFLAYLLLRKPPRFRPEHAHDLFMAHSSLLITDRNQTLCQVVIVFAHETVGDLEVIDISEHEGAALDVGVSAFYE